MLAEWTMAQFHICEFIFILYKELAAVLAHIDSNVWNYVLEVPLWVIWIEMTVV